MEHHESFVTHLLNQWLGTHFPDPVVVSFIVVLIGAGIALYLRPRLSVEEPGMLQQICEFLLINPVRFGIRDLLDDNVGHGGRKYMAFVGSVSIFILLCNLISLIPAFPSPTASVSVPLACAVLTFLHFNTAGFRKHGIGYLKHFAGPSPVVAPLIFPVEIISTTARILSLTVRLWANIFASELIYAIFLGMLMLPMQYLWGKFPPAAVLVGVFTATIPVAFIGLHIFVAVVQAFVFTILPSVYLGLATAEEH